MCSAWELKHANSARESSRALNVGAKIRQFILTIRHATRSFTSQLIGSHTKFLTKMQHSTKMFVNIAKRQADFMLFSPRGVSPEAHKNQNQEKQKNISPQHIVYQVFESPNLLRMVGFR